MGRGPAELRSDALKLGHRGRGAGVRQSIEEVERASLNERLRGAVWYANSAASVGGSGTAWGDEFTTIQECVNAASADDVISVAPSHVETVTAAAGLVLDQSGLTIIGYGNGDRRPQVNFTTVVGADMDVSSAGLTIVGLGNGDQRPQVNFTTVVGADVNIDAAGVTIKNVRFTGGIDALTGPVDVNAADFTMIDCVTEDVTGQATDFVVSDANADRMSVVRHEHRGAAAAGADSAFQLTGGDQITFEDAWIYGNFAAAGIESIGTAQTNLRIYGGANRPCYIRTVNAADVAVTLLTGSTGDVGPYVYARVADNAANVTEAFVGDAMRFMQPVGVVNLNGERGFETNITASAG